MTLVLLFIAINVLILEQELLHGWWKVMLWWLSWCIYVGNIII